MAIARVVVGADKIRRNLKDLERQVMAQALPRALNRTAQQAQTVAVREIAKRLGGIRQRDVRAAMRIERATADRPVAALIATGKPLSLIGFAPRPRKRTKGSKGITVGRGAGQRFYRHAFIATMKSGHTGVFRRKGAARLPIKELFGPPIPAVLRQAPVMAALRTVIRDRLKINLAADVRFYTARLLKKK